MKLPEDNWFFYPLPARVVFREGCLTSVVAEEGQGSLMKVRRIKMRFESS